MTDDAPRWYGAPYLVEMGIVGDLVQLALCEEAHPPPDYLPDVILNLTALDAANLGDSLKEYSERILRPS